MWVFVRMYKTTLAAAVSSDFYNATRGINRPIIMAHSRLFHILQSPCLFFFFWKIPFFQPFSMYSDIFFTLLTTLFWTQNNAHTAITSLREYFIWDRQRLIKNRKGVNNKCNFLKNISFLKGHHLGEIQNWSLFSFSCTDYLV